MTTIDDTRFTPNLDERRAELGSEVHGRNFRHDDQQGELLYRNQRDREAEHEAASRDYRAKEKEARRLARQADDPMEQLRLKKEARHVEQRVEKADNDLRDSHRRLRAEAD